MSKENQYQQHIHVFRGVAIIFIVFAHTIPSLDWSDWPLTGKLIYVSDIVNPETRTVTVRTEQLVSQPAPFSQGQTVTVPQDSVDVKEPEARFAMIESGATIGDLVKVLNTLGVTPRDIIAILQAAQNAGAISATLEVI